MSAKLFVGQVPKQINEDQLRPIFQEYGEIVELAILRDKFQVPKGLPFTSRRKAFSNVHINRVCFFDLHIKSRSRCMHTSVAQQVYTSTCMSHKQ